MTPSELRERLARYAQVVHGLCRPLLQSDESFFWLEHLRACRMLEERDLLPILKEARELVAILTTSHTAKKREAKEQLSKPKRR